MHLLIKMANSDIITNQYVRIKQTPASIGERVLARIIDYAVITFYVIGFLYIMNYFYRFIGNSWIDILFFIFLTIPVCFYDFLWETLNNGQSLGKYLMKIRVVSQDGSRPTIGAFFMRWLLSFVDIGVSGIGLFFILFSKNSQRLGDLAAGTMIIKLVDFTKCHVSLDEFYYIKKDYHPVYEEAKNLSQGQAELIEKALYSLRDDHDSQVDILAAKVAKFLNIQPKENSKETFLATILHDYQYYLMELI